MMKSTTDSAVATELRGERRLGHRMHTFSNMVQSHYYGRTEQPLGIALPEWRVLRAAILRPGISQAAVATGEGINVMNVSRAVAGLKRKGLIEVKSDPEDRRRTMLVATDLGRELSADIGARETKTYEHIFSVLSESEQRTLDDLLARVNDHVQHGELPPPAPPSRDWVTVLGEDTAAD